MPERFKNDLFVSYRRASNQTDEHWVDVFCGELRSSLSEMLGREVKIWRDDGIRAGDDWRRQLVEAVDGAAIFLAVFSYGYLKSDECRRELDQFLQRMKEPEGGSRKLFPVFKQPLDGDPPAPKELSALQSHEFFQWTPPGTGRFAELGPRNANAGERSFWTSLGWLAQDIQKSLAALDKRSEEHTLGKVFLSRVCPELEPYRKQLRADLQMSGYLVVPRYEYIWSEADNVERIAADLDGALLSVHLVTGGPSNDGDSVERSRMQLTLAQRAAGTADGGAVPAHAPLVWIQPTPEVDPAAAALVASIRGEFANAGVEYLSGSFEALKTEVHAKLRAASAKPAEPVPEAIAAGAAPAAVADVALIVEESELGETGPLGTLLAERLGVGLRPIKFSASEPKDPERMKKVLAACRRCIVYWSGQSEEWLDDVLNHPALAGHVGRATLCVQVAGARTPAKAVFHTPKATVVDATGTELEAGLKGFLSA